VIEPRKRQIGKDDVVNNTEINMGEGDWQVLTRFPGVIEHGMLDIGNRRQPGRPCRVFQWKESMLDK